MKKDIHPQMHETKVTCACGNTFVTMSTLPEITVEICSACHPFFTGQQKFIDTEGRIEKFQKKVALAKETAGAAPSKRKAKKAEKKGKAYESKSLKDILAQAQKEENK